MSRPETCSRCGEEVRWGWRPGQFSPTRPGSGFWMHRDPDADHAPVFGKIIEVDVGMPLATQDEEDTPDPIPLPEVRATAIEVGDDRLPGGAKQVMVLAAKHAWTAWATYSRGPRVHSSQGTLLSISDFVVVRLRLDGSDRRAVASWCDNKFDFGYNLTLDLERHKYITDRTNFAGLKAWIKNEEDPA